MSLYIVIVYIKGYSMNKTKLNLKLNLKAVILDVEKKFILH